MRRLWTVLGGIALATGLIRGMAVDAGELALEPLSNTEWTVTYQGKPACVYVYTPSPKKPYVRVLATIDGEDILRDAPHDHLHHHGLMYAIRIDGHNFWEETPGTGVQRHVKVLSSQIQSGADGVPRAVFGHRLYWLAEADAEATDPESVARLIEDRTLTVQVDPATREVALHWHAEFQVGPGYEQVTLTGSNYNGLGIRFRQDLDAFAVPIVAGEAIDLTGQPQRVTRGTWGVMTFPEAPRPVTAILIGSPTNARGEPWFFTMTQPFAYLAATQRLDVEPMVYRAGDCFSLEYVVVNRPGIEDGKAMTERATNWLRWLESRGLQSP